MAKDPDPLPVFGGLLDPLKESPTLDEARSRLGGPWIGGPDIGAVVRVSAMVGQRTGVIIHSSPTERDVWIGAGRIQRVSAHLAFVEEEHDESYEPVIADAKLHAGLTVGERVRFQRPDGSTGEGALVERLRYGSLIGTDEGKVLAVSFRRITPIVTEHAS